MLTTTVIMYGHPERPILQMDIAYTSQGYYKVHIGPTGRYRENLLCIITWSLSPSHEIH